ncbi:hypothetical protein Sjap_023822 [Stephania japonica]|uniref:Uncharacterized protein n=1 Tax=Stephania japonica TaxID=461633 RepID=A0AAP0HPK7_9MAGN
MAASLTTEPPERQRLYPRLHEGNGRQGFASTERQAGQSSGVVPEQTHTEVRDEGDQFDRRDRETRQMEIVGVITTEVDHDMRTDHGIDSTEVMTEYMQYQR